MLIIHEACAPNKIQIGAYYYEYDNKSFFHLHISRMSHHYFGSRPLACNEKIFFLNLEFRKTNLNQKIATARMEMILISN